MERRLKIRAVIDDVRTACDFVVEAAESLGFDSRAVYHCEIAVDETTTNIIEHGYATPAARAAADITLITRVEEGCLKIILRDNSPPFDPTRHKDPEIQNDASKMQPGGWGIYFVKQLMDSITYEHHDGYNVLTLTKCLPQSVEMAVQEDELRVRVSEAGKGYWTIMPQGRLDTQTAPMLQGTLHKQLEEGRYRLILDLSGVDYVSSSGLKVLAAAWRDANEKHGNLILTGLNARLHEIFDMVGFTTFFDIFPDVDHALKSAAT